MSRSIFVLWACLAGILGLVSACDTVTATMGGLIDNGDKDVVADEDETVPTADVDEDVELDDEADSPTEADEMENDAVDEDPVEIEEDTADPTSCETFLGEYCPVVTATLCSDLLSVSIQANSDTSSENPYIFVLQTASGPWPFDVPDCTIRNLPLGDCTLGWNPEQRTFRADCTGDETCSTDYRENECAGVDGDAEEVEAEADVDPDPEEEWDFECEECTHFVGNYCELSGDCMIFSSLRVEPRDGSCGFTVIVNRAIGGPLEIEVDSCHNWQQNVDVGAGQQCLVEYVAVSGEWTVTCTGQLACESTYTQDACHMVDGDADGLVCEGCGTFSGTYCEGEGANTCGVPEFEVVPGAAECQWDIQANIMGYPISYSVDGCGDWSMEQMGCSLQYTASTEHFSVNCTGYLNCQSDFSKDYCATVDGDEEEPLPDYPELEPDDPVTCVGCEDFPGTYCEDGGATSC